MKRQSKRCYICSQSLKGERNPVRASVNGAVVALAHNKCYDRAEAEDTEIAASVLEKMGFVHDNGLFVLRSEDSEITTYEAGGQWYIQTAENTSEFGWHDNGYFPVDNFEAVKRWIGLQS